MGKYLNNFQVFLVHSQDFSKSEKETLMMSIHDNILGRRLRLALLLFAWTFVSLFIESFLIGGGVVFSVVEGINWYYFLPEMSFVLLNFFAKFFYIRWYMKKEISFSHSMYASLPAIGPVIIFGILIRDNLLLARAFRLYIKERRKRFFSFKK